MVAVIIIAIAVVMLPGGDDKTISTSKDTIKSEFVVGDYIETETSVSGYVMSAKAEITSIKSNGVYTVKTPDGLKI